MTIHYQDDSVTLHHGDALDVLRGMPDASVDAVVTDPPYGLEFMGHGWDGADGFRRSLNPADAGRDSVFGRTSRTSPEYRAGALYQEWCETWARECLRALKPGGHLLAFGGTRTVHRLTCAIEDAGFEIRDGIDWIYAQGFPKSLDVSKAIDKAARGEMVREKLLHFAKERGVDGRWLEAAGVASAASFGDWTVGGHVPSDRNWQLVKAALGVTADEEAAFERTVIGVRTNGIASGTGRHAGMEGAYGFAAQYAVTAGATDDARRWEGWGTALKPAREPIVVARKPLAGTVAGNVQAYSTGALNVDACRVTISDAGGQPLRKVTGIGGNPREAAYRLDSSSRAAGTTDVGRWPTNAILTHAATPDGVDLCAGGCVDGCPVAELDQQGGTRTSGANPIRRSSDKFRDAYGEFKGQTDCVPARGADSGVASRFFPVFRYEAKASSSERPKVDGVAHSTVKPLDLMRWLVRLVTPPSGTVLEPFAGSGTTAEACVLEGFRCIAVEREAAYLPLITARLTKPLQPALDLFGGEVA